MLFLLSLFLFPFCSQRSECFHRKGEVIKPPTNSAASLASPKMETAFVTAFSGDGFTLVLIDFHVVILLACLVFILMILTLNSGI
jgi:hypothetical protein